MVSRSARWLKLWPRGSQPSPPCQSVAIVDFPCAALSCLRALRAGPRPVNLHVILKSSERGEITRIFEFDQESDESNGSVKFLPSEPILVELDAIELVRLEVHDVQMHRCIAFAEIDPELLATKRAWRLLLQDPSSCEAIYGTSDRGAADSLDRNERPLNRRPSFLHLVTQDCSSEALDGASTPSTASRETEEPRLRNRPAAGSAYSVPSTNPTGRRKVMLITRGTRGDVQPFVALARGLVLYHDCDVVLVTELFWRKFCMDNLKDLNVPEGRIRFRPCGGDTAQRVNTDLSRTFLSIGQHSVAIQALVFSRSEVEFFDSEGCFYHWAWEERPDFIVFGFLLTHVAMIISEALNIPVVGFILQPHREIEPVSAGNALEELLGPMRGVLGGPQFIALLQQVMERLPDKYTLRDLRLSRNLAPLRSTFSVSNEQEKELKVQGIPMIVPVSPVALGETQAHSLEEKGMTLTDFIFLRRDDATPALPEDASNFIRKAKSEGRKVVLMTFSSMPVGYQRILKIAVKICHDCRIEGLRPVVIAMVKGQPQEQSQQQSLMQEADRWKQKQRLLVVDTSLDFGALFPQVDAIMLHGGLGVTCEALLAGKPTITSGILLMDQRYWASRMHDLGCGSKGISVDDLLSDDGASIVTSVEAALASGGGSWAEKALQVKNQLQAYRNAFVVVDLQNQEDWRHYHRSFNASQDDYFLRDRNGEIMNFGVLNDYSEPAADRFPVQVLKQQVVQSQDPGGLRRNAEAVFAAGVERRAVVTNGYNRNRNCTCCRCFCRQTGCLLQCLKETMRFLLCLQVPACLFFWLKMIRACLCCKPLKSMFLWLYPRRTMAPGPMDSLDSFAYIDV